MLPCRDHAVILQTMDECDAHPRREIRIFAVGARIDVGVIRIVVDVEDRRVRDVNPERAPFECGETSLLVSERRISRCTDPHLWREHNRSSVMKRSWFVADYQSSELSSCSLPQPERALRPAIASTSASSVANRALLAGIDV